MRKRTLIKCFVGAIAILVILLSFSLCASADKKETSSEAETETEETTTKSEPEESAEEEPLPEDSDIDDCRGGLNDEEFEIRCNNDANLDFDDVSMFTLPEGTVWATITGTDSENYGKYTMVLKNEYIEAGYKLLSLKLTDILLLESGIERIDVLLKNVKTLETLCVSFKKECAFAAVIPPIKGYWIAYSGATTVYYVSNNQHQYCFNVLDGFYGTEEEYEENEIADFELVNSDSWRFLYTVHPIINGYTDEPLTEVFEQDWLTYIYPGEVHEITNDDINRIVDDVSYYREQYPEVFGTSDDSISEDGSDISSTAIEDTETEAAQSKAETGSTEVASDAENDTDSSTGAGSFFKQFIKNSGLLFVLLFVLLIIYAVIKKRNRNKIIDSILNDEKKEDSFK